MTKLQINLDNSFVIDIPIGNTREVRRPFTLSRPRFEKIDKTQKTVLGRTVKMGIKLIVAIFLTVS